MKKKLPLLFLLIFMCFSLSGCALLDFGIARNLKQQVENVFTGSQTSSLKDTVANDNMFSMEKGTKKAQNKALKAADKAANLQDRAANTHFPRTLWPGNWFLQSRADAASVKANKALNKYESKKAADSTWLKAREKAGLSGVNGQIQWSKYGPIVGIAVAILFFFIVLMFKRKKIENKNLKRESKAKAKAIKRGDAEIVVQESPEQFDSGYTDASETQAKLSARSDEKSAAACRKYCDKYGIDYETYLAQYNGDNKALLDFLISSSKEDFQ